MSRDSNINQFIPLHFYEVSEKLPDDDSYKICITPNNDFIIANYNAERSFCKWLDDSFYERDVIAWASFSPEWVTGTYPGEWGKQ